MDYSLSTIGLSANLHVKGLNPYSNGLLSEIRGVQHKNYWNMS